MKKILTTAFIYLSFLIFSLSSNAHSQDQEIEDIMIVIPDTVGVVADRSNESRWHCIVTDVDIKIQGYYRIVIKILYNSGDEQTNETFYLMVTTPGGTVSAPVDSNAGPYKIVLDDPGDRHIAWRDAGLFYFGKGLNIIEMYHLVNIEDEYPEFLNGPIEGPQSVKVPDSLKLVAEPLIDGVLELEATTARKLTIDGEVRDVAYPGETVSYQLTIRNEYQNLMRSAKLYNYLPTDLTAEEFSYSPTSQTDGQIVWDLPDIEPQDSFLVTITAKLSDSLQVSFTPIPIINEAALVVSNDIDTTNNRATATIYALADSQEVQPKIEALPAQVDVTDSIRIRVYLPPYTESWDLWIYFPDGQIDKSFADNYIATAQLNFNEWYDIEDVYRPTRLISTAKKEQLIFEIRTTSMYGHEASAQDDVLVLSSNYLVLDRNVYKPEYGDQLGIRFKLSSRRIAQLDIYDISGRHITKVTENVYQGGWNTYPWDGMSDTGLKVGSGVYLVTLRSGEFNSWKKFLLVR